ncbi:hypothetical protein BIW11_11061 [Tropilaelaps mercedesae]|uniref:Uncharacterized protein n=1 Tax=Tropilaelaps mercedesae TaxID=418985 RepID=A0A1V9XDB1_9ACAR|nr:hypothetical protein BIW11_11061 [Tropilaelaps mercedesae]
MIAKIFALLAVLSLIGTACAQYTYSGYGRGYSSYPSGYGNYGNGYSRGYGGSTGYGTYGQGYSAYGYYG